MTWATATAMTIQVLRLMAARLPQALRETGSLVAALRPRLSHSSTLSSRTLTEEQTKPPEPVERAWQPVSFVERR
jgi:hypothetical protein